MAAAGRRWPRRRPPRSPWTTNPAFVDTFLLGLNAQVVGELRFRQLPADPRLDPGPDLRDRANPATGDMRYDDIGLP
ncbi:MAG: hypothetical protein WKF76_10345 [Nocardioidaceae bacterium]